MLLTMLAALTTLAAAPADSPAVYQAVFIRAAPAHLLHLIDAVKARMPVYDAAEEHRPLVLRHAQGDQWDLMLLIPIGSVAEHFGEARAGRWRAAVKKTGFDDGQFARQLDQWVSWREELYVVGPSVGALDAVAGPAGYFHLEIFQALAGKRDSLRAERKMENDFLARTGRPTNLIFDKLTGPAWDSFTIGFYRDLPHYAEPAKVAAAEEDAAARSAGFESRNHLGSYLRQLISAHHDTLGPIVR